MPFPSQRQFSHSTDGTHCASISSSYWLCLLSFNPYMKLSVCLVSHLLCPGWTLSACKAQELLSLSAVLLCTLCTCSAIQKHHYPCTEESAAPVRMAFNTCLPYTPMCPPCVEREKESTLSQCQGTISTVTVEIN